MNEKETKKKDKINKTKSWCFEKTNEIDKSSVRIIKKGGSNQYNQK